MLAKRFHLSFLLTGFLICLVAAPSAFAEFTRINAPSAADPMDVHIYQLDNGLTIYLTENHEEPRFYAEISVRAGSNQDPPESTGLAHYLEHLLFKGTQKIGTLNYKKEKVHLDRITGLYEDHRREKDPEKRRAIYAKINAESQLAAQYAIPNEIDKIYKDMGATNVNAHTWPEETVYKVGLPANRLEQWAIIESERFQNPVFRLFQPELEIVYEEKNRSMDSKSSRIWEAVLATLFKKHPYGQQTTIGTVEHLKNPSLKNIYGYFNTYYVPNNMAICISGDIDIDETIQLIDAHFSVWKSKKLPKPRTWKETPIKGVERVTVKFPGEEYVQLGFRIAPRNHPDTEALKLLDMILDNSTAGLINLNLVQQQKVRRAGCGPWFLNDYGIETFYGVPKKDQTLEEVEQLLIEQLDLIKRGEFDDWILPAIVTDFKKSQKRELESNTARVRKMTNAFLSYGDWDHIVTEIARMEQLTKADIVRMVDKYYSDGYVAGYRIDEQHELPKIEKPQIDKIDIDPTRQSKFAADVLAMPVRKIQPTFITDKDYARVDIADGVRLYYTQNPINDLYAFTINVEMGTYQDNRLGTAKALLDKSGAGDLNAEALKKEWYKLGTDFNIGVEDHETNLRISGLDENFEASLALMLKCLKTPTAEQATLDELVRIVIGKREDEKKDPRALRDALRYYNRYGDDSVYKRRISSEAMQKLTVEELHHLMGSLLGYRQTLIYTGSQPLENVLAIIKKQYPLSNNLQEPPAYEHLAVRAPMQTELRFFHKEMAQSLVFVEFGDATFDSELRPAIDLFNDYFSGGMSGIVFQELREARALAYSTYARYEQGDRLGDQNFMWGYIGCQADKTPEAVAALIDLIDNLPETPERFEEAKNAVINRYRVSKFKFREIPGVLRTWEHRGLTPDPRRARFEKIQQADMNLMLNFHKAHVQSRPKIISVLGDTSKIGMTSLSKIAAPTAVSLDDLFRE